LGSLLSGSLLLPLTLPSPCPLTLSFSQINKFFKQQQQQQKKPFLITRSIGRQIGLHEEIEFPVLEDNKKGSGGLKETLKKVLELQIRNTQDEL